MNEMIVPRGSEGRVYVRGFARLMFRNIGGSEISFIWQGGSTSIPYGGVFFYSGLDGEILIIHASLIEGSADDGRLEVTPL
jgi:hypothetical protein